MMEDLKTWALGKQQDINGMDRNALSGDPKSHHLSTLLQQNSES